MSIIDFAVGLQEIVIANRHGRIDEASGADDELQRDLARAMEAKLAYLEVKFETTLRTPALEVAIKMSHFYSYRGCLWRVGYPNSGALHNREWEPKANEIRLLQCAGYLVEAATGMRPKGLRLMLHELTDKSSPALMEVAYSQSFEVHHPSLKEGEQIVGKFLHELALQLQIEDDSKLVRCTEDECGTKKGHEFGKCWVSCKARENCHQAAERRAECIAGWERTREAIANPDMGEGLAEKAGITPQTPCRYGNDSISDKEECV